MYDKLGSLLSDALDSGSFFSENAEKAAETKKKNSPEHPKHVNKKQNTKNPARIKPISEEIRNALDFCTISENMTFEEAKKQYRARLQSYHPDKRNNNPVLQKVAKEKTEKLLEKWSIVKKWYES